jgi:hypothetical protein
MTNGDGEGEFLLKAIGMRLNINTENSVFFKRCQKLENISFTSVEQALADFHYQNRHASQQV